MDQDRPARDAPVALLDQIKSNKPLFINNLPRYVPRYDKILREEPLPWGSSLFLFWSIVY